MEPGTIVYKQEYKNNKLVTTRYIILFSKTSLSKPYYIGCPITSHINAFNNNPHNYFLLPFQGSNYRKMYFAKLNSLTPLIEEEIMETKQQLSLDLLLRILKKIRDNYSDFGYEEYYDNIIHTIEKKLSVN